MLSLSKKIEKKKRKKKPSYIKETKKMDKSILIKTYWESHNKESFGVIQRKNELGKERQVVSCPHA